MPSTYSTNLALELLAPGEQTGTWGTTTNTNLGTLLEQSISGYVTQAITDGSGANTTITIPNGATGVARNMFIEMTGALTFSTTSLIVPANKKLYFIHNNTTGGFAVTVKVSGLTGVSVPNGRKVILVSNGTDIVEAYNAISGNATVGGTLAVTGVATLTAQPILSSLTASSAVATDASKGLVSVTNTGSGSNVLATSPTLVTPLLGTPTSGLLTNCTGLPVAGGGTGAATLTSNNVLLGNGTGAVQVVAPSTSGNVLTSNGTTWSSTAPAAAGGITLGTEQASTSGTSIDFTGIPSGTRRVTIMLTGVSFDTQPWLRIQLGDSGGIENTGYLGAGVSTPATAIVVNGTAGADFVAAGFDGATVIHGTIVCNLMVSSSNTWTITGMVGHSNTTYVWNMAYSKPLSAVLDRVRITTTNGTSVFDAGTINISYEK